MRAWRRCWDHFVQYVGSSPYGAPAVLCAIAHMQTAQGVWYPMGGTRAVAEGMARFAGENGARLRSGEDVEGLAMDGARVAGVRTARGVERYDAIISNMDSVRTYRELVGGEVGAAHARRKIRAGLFGRGALSRPEGTLRPPAAPQFRLLPRPQGGV